MSRIIFSLFLAFVTLSGSAAQGSLVNCGFTGDNLRCGADDAYGALCDDTNGLANLPMQFGQLEFKQLTNVTLKAALNLGTIQSPNLLRVELAKLELPATSSDFSFNGSTMFFSPMCGHLLTGKSMNDLAVKDFNDCYRDLFVYKLKALNALVAQGELKHIRKGKTAEELLKDLEDGEFEGKPIISLYFLFDISETSFASPSCK